jgi:dTDP-4-amino-4,6-dideoxygalactose transaminase
VKAVPWRDRYLVFGAPQVGADERAEILACLDSGWLGSGPRVAALEEKMRAYFGAAAVVAVNSGTAALHLSLLELDLEPGAEVITTPMTFCATVNAIVHAGARPVLADCDPVTMNIDPAEIRRRITARTRAIVPVHFAGRPCDMAAIAALAGEHRLRVVEDCAHAIESTVDGRHCGTLADFGCFSFYVTKAMTTAEGGMVVCRDPALADRIRVRALHGMSKDAWHRYRDEGYVHYDVVEPGFKYNLTDLAASLGLHQMARLEGNWIRRRVLWDYYQRELRELPLVLPPPSAPGTRDALHLYTILVDDRRTRVTRDQLQRGLHELRIGSGVHYRPVHLFSHYRRTYGYAPGDFPHAEHIGARTLSLPLSPAVTDDDAADVVRALRLLLG